MAKTTGKPVKIIFTDTAGKEQGIEAVPVTITPARITVDMKILYRRLWWALFDLQYPMIWRREQ